MSGPQPRFQESVKPCIELKNCMTRVKQAVEIQIISKGKIVNNDHQFGRTEVDIQLVADINCFSNTFIFRDNVHSHLRHAKRPMAVRGGGGGGGGGVLSNGRFAWTKWDFCSEVKKMY